MAKPKKKAPVKAVEAVQEPTEVSLPGTEEKPSDVQPEKPKSFYIAPGKSITSSRGILSSGEQVQSTDLSGGLDRINALVTLGVVVIK